MLSAVVGATAALVVAAATITWAVGALGGRDDAHDTVEGRAEPFCAAAAAAVVLVVVLAFTVAALSDSIFCSSEEMEMALGAGVDFQGLLAPEERTSLSMDADTSKISVGML